MRTRNFEKCAESCKQIPAQKQKEKWYIICKARTEESWTDFTEPDDGTSADLVFDESILAEVPMPGTSLRTSYASTRGSRPVTKSGRPVSGYMHPENLSGKSRAGCPTTSTTSRMTRLATASLAFSGDEPDVTSINMAQFAKSPHLSRILVDYILHRLHDPIRAVSLAAEATKVHGFDDWWWKNRLGRSYYLLGLYPEAEAQFRSSLYNQNSIDSRLELVKVYTRIDQPTKAISELDCGLEDFPKEIRFILGQARLADRLGNTSKAREMWRKVLEVDQTSVEAIANLGSDTFYEDQPEASSKFYSYLCNIGLVNPQVLNNIAMSSLSAGDYAIVGPAIVAALSLATDPEDISDIWYNISHIAITAGDIVLAKQALMISTAISGKNGEAFNNLGLIELRYKNVQKALAAFHAAIEANPEMHEPWFNLALLYQRIGELQEAYLAAKEAVRLYPMFTEGITLLEELAQLLK